ncbi:MAG: cytochrome c-type biosis protein CcmE [Myxococcales bacterium]|nr:cytochrome c-type biosis protein CcmE [Myxococcales bacterium]
MQNSTIAKLALSAAVLVAGVAFFAKSAQTSTQHYYKVEKLLATDLSQWKDTQLKVHGKVVAGSIKEKVVAQETMRTFVLENEGKKIRVFSKGPKPDTFKDQSEVVATGLVVPSAQMVAMAESLGVNIDSDMAYVVDSSELMAKCPSKYDGANANKDLDSGSAVKFK